MSKKKKLLILLLVCVLVVGIIGIIITVVKRTSSKTVLVYSVDSLAMDYYDDYNDESISGNVSNQVTQKVQLDSDSVVSEIYVSVGDKVKAGDKLMSYDTTLVEMELELEKLTMESNEKKLQKAKDRLTSLENGGPIEESDGESDSGDSGSYDNDSSDEDELTFRQPTSGLVSVSAFHPISVKTDSKTPASTQEPEETKEPEETQTPEETTEPEETSTPTPEETPVNTTPEVYAVLDYDSQPYKGSGTADDPYRFLCDANEDYIVAKASFLNKMSGYDAAGENKIEEDGPFWYVLEFHKNNKIKDLDNIEKSMIGYYLKKGTKKPVGKNEERHFLVDNATLSSDDVTILTPTPTQEPDEEFDDDDDYDDDDDFDEDEETTLTREEAIKIQKSNIQSLELTIKTNKLQISKLEQKVENQTVLASIDGTVTVVGDPITGDSDGEGFLEVESEEGQYITGTLSESMLEQVEVGDKVTVLSYDSGERFQAEIREISQFPVDSSDNYSYSYGYGSSNPNVSQYSFLAVIDGDVELSNDEWLSITINGKNSSQSGLYIEAAFVRSEDGTYYVYKEKDGLLVKQIVSATKTSDGYSVKITSGLTKEDNIAFPYGTGVKEGAKTEEGSLSDLYGY